MTDLNALVIFAKVVEANSFSEAARRLKMPISTVSRRIADLEDQLGVRLLERSTRSLRLTDVGSEVFEHAQRSSELSETVDSMVSNKMSNVSGLLRLSASDHSTFSATRFGRDRRLAETKSALSASSPRSATKLPKGYGWRCGGGKCICAAILSWMKSPDGPAPERARG
jgi:DNA-binding transcriptional LysR family regulator